MTIISKYEKQPKLIREHIKPTELDSRFKILLLFVIAYTRGGENRAKILNLIKDNPRNTNQIALALNVDYKTIIYHMKVLSKNKMITKARKNYGAEYEFTQIMKESQSVLKEVIQKIKTK